MPFLMVDLGGRRTAKSKVEIRRTIVSEHILGRYKKRWENSTISAVSGEVYVLVKESYVLSR